MLAAILRQSGSPVSPEGGREGRPSASATAAAASAVCPAAVVVVHAAAQPSNADVEGINRARHALPPRRPRPLACRIPPPSGFTAEGKREGGEGREEGLGVRAPLRRPLLPPPPPPLCLPPRHPTLRAQYQARGRTGSIEVHARQQTGIGSERSASG